MLRGSMHTNTRWSTIVALWTLFLHHASSAPSISYCSNQNNAGAYPAYYEAFMSTGLCSDRCTGSFAFAVIQGNNCWCSNYVPSNQENTYDCHTGCPGIDTEWCASAATGVFAYYLLSGGQPLGTSGDGSVASSTSYSPVSTTLSSSGPVQFPPSVQTTFRSSSILIVTPVTQQSPVQSTYSTYVPSSERPSGILTTLISPTTSQSTTFVFSITSSPPDSSSSTSMPTEVYPSVTTITGQVRTVLVTPSPTAGALGQSSSSGGGGVSTGKVVGIVIGVALGIGIVIAGGVWYWLRTKHRSSSRGTSPNGSFSPQRTDISNNSVPSRQVSQMSQAGLLGKRPTIQTNGFAAANELRNPDTISPNVDRRSLGTDQRLNPYALYAHEERNVSSVSLQDNQDYSRQLRVANPDP